MPKPTFDLVYYVWSETLIGQIGKESFRIHAVTGGGRGRTKGKEERSMDSFSPYRATDKSEDVRGGALPPGRWRIEKPSEYKGKMRKPVAKLTPKGNQLTDFAMRDYTDAPFLIHGRGEEGSDGCLVIEPDERQRLLNAVEEAGGAILFVTLDTRPGDMIQKTPTFHHTA
ncbi:hypothetical protein JI739_04635 [Ramlibacter sp. AW1]|uniref:DUF2778 domain-containing protein n=1 Tax=Ramlibacter aurantiacus TaxID=2801330 RepID=A0A937D6B3_9BURK|nr:hypothetical protein [Ramlibacter aurantiacus]MBL0419631.1 hypothetical protein [Ramlibacter aurantiacus]